MRQFFVVENNVELLYHTLCVELHTVCALSVELHRDFFPLEYENTPSLEKIYNSTALVTFLRYVQGHIHYDIKTMSR